MVMDLLSNVFWGLAGLLKGSFFLAIQAYAVFLVANYLRKKIRFMAKWPWLRAAAATAYLTVLALVHCLYWLPFLSVLGKGSTGEIPPLAQESALDVLGNLVLQELRLAVVAVVLAAALLPLILVGDYVFERLQKRFGWNYFLPSFLAVYFVTTLLMGLLFVSGQTWVVTGIIYFVLYGFIG